MSGYLAVLAVAVAIGVSAWRSRSVVAGHLPLLSLGWLLGFCRHAGRHRSGLHADDRRWRPGIWQVASVSGSGRCRGTARGGVNLRRLPALGRVSAIVQIDLHDVSLALEMVWRRSFCCSERGDLEVAGRENRLIRTLFLFRFCLRDHLCGQRNSGFAFGKLGLSCSLAVWCWRLIAFLVMKIEKRFKAGQEPVMSTKSEACCAANSIR
jgi:hypothetical protein